MAQYPNAASSLQTDPIAARPLIGEAVVKALSHFDQVKQIAAQQHVKHLHAHANHLTAYQRESGMRIRLCSTGCYAVYNMEGNFIARTPPAGTLTGLPVGALKSAAARMAYSEELVNVCRLADVEFESAGTVSEGTVAMIRKLLMTIDTA